MNSKVQVDQPSTIKRLIMQHVQEDINRPDYRKLADKINSKTWVIMKPSVAKGLFETTTRNQMCRVVHAHGEYATLHLCCEDSESYSMGFRTVTIHLSKWSEHFEEWHTDFYDLEEAMSTVVYTPLIIEKD
jgi:hypothetical protein